MQGGAGADRTLGLFMNTLPIRIRIGEEGVESGARRVHRLLAELIGHEHASLALAQRLSGVEAPTPLFSALLNYRHTTREAEKEAKAAPSWEGIEILASEERTNYPLMLSVEDLGEGLALTAQTVRQIGPWRVCDYMRTALERLVEALERAPETALKAIDVMPEAERRQVMEEWNATEADYPREKLIHELFEEQVERSPHAVALVYEEQSLTYGELNARANRLARHLRKLGVGPEERVAICLERSLEMVVALLATLKAGAAYVPLDPAYPSTRLAYMLEDSAPVVLLTHEAAGASLAARLPAITALDLENDETRWIGQSEQNLERSAAGSDARSLAYVIYTSGSTGQPKGAMNEHGGALNRLVWMQEAYGLSLGDAVLQKTPFSFDVSVWEFFWPLLNGARLVMASPGGHKDPAYLARIIRRQEITTLHFVPSMLQMFLENPEAADCREVARVICSGESLPERLTNRFYELLPESELHNLYGPTEAAVDVTAWNCKDETRSNVISIGRPVANTSMYVLGAEWNPAPVGVAGELYIGGAQVGRGYHYRPEMTAERFLPDPFSRERGGRVYRTGDLGRWLPEGTIEFLGRNDSQVKIRGFRIELGEVEARLVEHSEVEDAVVIAGENGAGSQRLIAYYTGAEIGAEALRAHLARSLPDYMTPAAYVRLERLPLTPSGKLDRRALPAPEGGAYATRGYEAPEGETEKKLAQIWADVLKVEQVGRHDNFFELGGHSLSAITVIERMRREGMQADVRTLFTAPTPQKLAEAVKGGKESEVETPPRLIPEGCERITPGMLTLIELTQAEIDGVADVTPGGAANIQDIYPLAPLQEGILFHHLMSEEGDAYLLSSLLAFDTRERLERFVGALESVISRHDTLRTAIVWEGLPEPAQVVWRKAPLVVEEVSPDPTAGDIAEELYTRFGPRRYRIDVRQAPLIRVYVAHDAVNDRWLMLQLFHHLSVDHTTIEVLQQEIQAHLLGSAEQAQAPAPFRNFVAQARLGVSQKEHESFFREMLWDVDEPTTPYGLINVHGDGSGIRDAWREVDPELAGRLRRT
jgi:amino acid adenylation domain-containing protein